MYKSSKHGKKKKEFITTDVTLHDYADSRPGQHSGLRTKKSKRANIDKKEVSKMSSEVKEELSWFEKSLEDFDDLQHEEQEDQEQATEDEERLVEEQDIAVLKKSFLPLKRQHSVDHTGNVYPVDLWCQISRFVNPEDIGTFALLCKGSNSVVNTVQFWKVLHLRFYREQVTMPECLTMRSLECIHGLRARVIQMLNYVYPPLVARIQTSVPFENQPHCLVGQRCILAWHKKVRNVWKFYFKFCKSDKIDVSSNKQRRITSRYFEKWHQDLFYNPDNDCSVLEATTQAFVRLPMVMGLVLNRVYLNVSSASMLHQKLKLVLDSSFKRATAKNQSGMYELVLDPVLEARVYPWWDPKYHESHSSLECEP